MSSAGLPSSGQSAFSLLDHEGVTTSDFVQHVDYQRALETELDSTIGSISGVQNAQVNLAIPQNTVFTDSTQKTTGAVLLSLTPGTTLTSVAGAFGGQFGGLERAGPHRRQRERLRHDRQRLVVGRFRRRRHRCDQLERRGDPGL